MVQPLLIFWPEKKRAYKERSTKQIKEYVTKKHVEQTKNNQGGSKQKDQDYTTGSPDVLLVKLIYKQQSRICM